VSLSDDSGDSIEPSRNIVRRIRLSFWLLCILHGAGWTPFVIPILEPMGSGGFALHLLALYSNLGMLAMMIIDMTYIRGKTKVRIKQLQVLAFVSTIVGLVILVGS
jgi:hypothetical protein